MRLSFTGDKAIDNILRNLPQAVSHPVLSAAHAKAAAPLVEREKLLAPEGPTGNLIDSIGLVRVSLKRAGDVGEVLVGPRTGGRNRGGHAILVSKGTRRRTNRRGANRGVMPSNPYIEKAFGQEVNRVKGLIGQEVAKSLLRTMKRYNRA